MTLTAPQRRTRASMAGFASHAARDSREATAPARRRFLERFEKQVDPDGLLDPAERERRAISARRSYFKGLALRSSIARSKRAQARREVKAAS